MLRKSTVSFISTSTRRLHSRAGHFRYSIPNTSGTSVLANPDLLVHHGMQKLFHSNSKPYDSPTKEASSKCPFSQLRNASSEALEGITAQTSGNNSPLSIVPTIPIFGSFFSIIPGIGEPLRKYFNVPKMLPNNIYDYYLAMNKQYGDFYVLNVPGIGKIHSINDPSEMMKVLRSEGAYPIGGISTLRAFIKWSKARNLTITNGEDNGFFGQGDTWRTIRTFMQSDLLSPQSARGYVPGIVEAAKNASKGAEYYADDLNTYFNYCAFDMFQTIMFGELTETANPSTHTDPINQEFVENSILSLNLMLKQNFDMVENIKGRMGITTPTYRKFEVALDRVNEIANDKIHAFKKKWERGELSESELSSYIAHAFERQKEGEAISPETLREITMITLNSGVDTTSNFICWAMVHLSLNPDVQEKLYQELKDNVDENEGTLSSDIISKSKSPYLHAVLRESHRLTPVQPSTMLKANSTKDIEVNGKTIPKGSLFAFESYTKGMNPDYVESPHQFLPERWTDEAIESRKGTPAAILDHQFYKDPFSQGARRCPGSRVAVNETLVLLSQIVLDWKFEPKETIESFKDVKYEKKTFLVPVVPKMNLTSRK